MKTIDYQLKHKLREVFFVSPNDLGIPLLTFWYRRLTSFLKVMPFIYIIPSAFFLAFLLYLLFGVVIVKLTTLLQYGF